MAYMKAIIVALFTALVLGAATGAWWLFRAAVESLRPEDKAVIYSRAISEAMNCVAFFVLLLTPLAVVVVAAWRRWRSAPSGPQ